MGGPKLVMYNAVARKTKRRTLVETFRYVDLAGGNTLVSVNTGEFAIEGHYVKLSALTGVKDEVVRLKQELKRLKHIAKVGV